MKPFTTLLGLITGFFTAFADRWQERPPLPPLLGRLWGDVVKVSDSFINVLAEPLKILLPWQVPFWRPDNIHGWVWDWKPTGYWVAHLVGIPAFLLALWFAGTLAGLVFTVLMGMVGAPVHF